MNAICYPETTKFTTKATTWGCKHEQDALKMYEAQIKALHENSNITHCGLYISYNHPLLGATPDALVECVCCGKEVVEVKCPLCAEMSSFEELACGRPAFCLEKCKTSGKLHLKHSQEYYYQCQLQLFITERAYCDFVVWSNDELFVERLSLNQFFIESSLSNAKVFYQQCILPELLGKYFSRQSKKSIRAELVPTEEDDGSWCHCKGGSMVACDNKSCHTTWFHLQCVKLSSIPRGKWYCEFCKANKIQKHEQ